MESLSKWKLLSTPELLEKILAENWDGKLPNTYVGDGSGLEIILPNS